MIGLIQKTILDLLLLKGGEAAVREALAAAGIDAGRVFRIDEDYPDAEFARLFAAACTVAEVTSEEMNVLFAEHFLEVAEQVFPKFFQMAQCSRDLIRMQVKIHSLIAAGQRGSQGNLTSDKFCIVDEPDGSVLVQYRSPAQLCGLYKALARAVADRWGEDIEVDTLSCRKAGSDRCDFALKWPGLICVDPTAGPFETEVQP